MQHTEEELFASRMRLELVAQVNLLNNRYVFIVPLTTNSQFSLLLVKCSRLVRGRWAHTFDVVGNRLTSLLKGKRASQGVVCVARQDINRTLLWKLEFMSCFGPKAKSDWVLNYASQLTCINDLTLSHMLPNEWFILELSQVVLGTLSEQKWTEVILVPEPDQTATISQYY